VKIEFIKNSPLNRAAIFNKFVFTISLALLQKYRSFTIKNFFSKQHDE